MIKSLHCLILFNSNTERSHQKFFITGAQKKSCKNNFDATCMWYHENDCSKEIKEINSFNTGILD